MGAFAVPFHHPGGGIRLFWPQPGDKTPPIWEKDVPARVERNMIRDSLIGRGGDSGKNSMLAADRAVAADYTSAADGNNEQLTAWPSVRRSFAVNRRAAGTISVAATHDFEHLTAGAAAIANGANAAGTATIAARGSGSRDVARTLIRNCRLRECY